MNISSSPVIGAPIQNNTPQHRSRVSVRNPKDEAPKADSGDQISLGHKVLVGTGSGLLGGLIGGVTGGGTALIMGSSLVTGDQSGVLGIAAIGAIGGAALGVMSGVAVGHLVESKTEGAILGGTAGAVVGAMGALVTGANPKEIALITVAAAAAGASSGLISAGLQRKD